MTPSFITLFEVEMAHLTKIICELPEYAAIKSHCSNKVDPSAVQRSTFATIIIYHEAKMVAEWQDGRCTVDVM